MLFRLEEIGSTNKSANVSERSSSFKTNSTDQKPKPRSKEYLENLYKLHSDGKQPKVTFDEQLSSNVINSNKQQPSHSQGTHSMSSSSSISSNNHPHHQNNQHLQNFHSNNLHGATPQSSFFPPREPQGFIPPQSESLEFQNFQDISQLQRDFPPPPQIFSPERQFFNESEVQQRGNFEGSEFEISRFSDPALDFHGRHSQGYPLDGRHGPHIHGGHGYPAARPYGSYPKSYGYNRPYRAHNYAPVNYGYLGHHGQYAHPVATYGSFHHIYSGKFGQFAPDFYGGEYLDELNPYGISLLQKHRFSHVSILLRGPTPLKDMIFYLWTDSNEICTAYVKLKINPILLKNF